MTNLHIRATSVLVLILVLFIASCLRVVAGATNELSATQTPVTASARLALQADQLLQKAIPTDDRPSLAQAARLLEDALSADPENSAVRKTLGWVYLEKLHQPRAAYPHLTALVRAHPDDLDARKLLALACSQTGRLSRSVTAFKQILSVDPDDLWIQFNLARTLARLDHRSEAQTLYDAILRKDPTNFHARLGLAELAAWRGRLGQAESSLQALLQEKPNDPEAEELLADIHRWNWRLSEAQPEYARVLEKEPNFENARTGLASLREAAGWRLQSGAYHFTDNTDFGRSSLDGSLRAPLSDQLYLLGGIAAWEFTHPAFSDLDELEGYAGLEYHYSRWLEISGRFATFGYENRSPFFGGQLLTKVSPVPGEDLYLAASVNQPFRSSISTVHAGLRQDSIGGGADLRLGRGFSLQNKVEWARISDENHWLDVKPQVSYQVLSVPEIYTRLEYEYLTYEESRATYWTPHDRQVLSPVVDFSFGLNQISPKLRLDATAKVPYVFNQSKAGVQIQAGPVVEFFHQLRLSASYIYSAVPGDLGAWSGSGWQAALSWSF